MYWSRLSTEGRQPPAKCNLPAVEFILALSAPKYTAGNKSNEEEAVKSLLVIPLLLEMIGCSHGTVFC